jgi:hypothetical protein
MSEPSATDPGDGSLASGDAQTAPVPDELVGGWVQGSASQDLFDPVVGAWRISTSSGFRYRFAEDGSYEFSGCMSAYDKTIASYERGTARVEGGELTLQPLEKWVRQPSGQTTHSNDEAPQRYGWRVGPDFIGSLTLALRYPDGQEGIFYAEQSQL